MAKSRKETKPKGNRKNKVKNQRIIENNFRILKEIEKNLNK